MPHQPKLTRQAKRASQRTADLRRDTYRAAMFFRNENSLRQFAFGQSDEVSTRAVDGIKTAVHRRQLDIPLGCQRRPKGFRQIRHGFEVIEPALIHGFEKLSRSERRLKDFGQLRPFKIEEFHALAGICAAVSATRSLASSLLCER